MPVPLACKAGNLDAKFCDLDLGTCRSLDAHLERASEHIEG
jgi:hypothetical protein